MALPYACRKTKKKRKKKRTRERVKKKDNKKTRAAVPTTMVAQRLLNTTCNGMPVLDAVGMLLINNNMMTVFLQPQLPTTTPTAGPFKTTPPAESVQLNAGPLPKTSTHTTSTWLPATPTDKQLGPAPVAGTPI